MKIIYYEFKRIWLGRLFPIMLVCTCVYAFIWMRTAGIAGSGGTAPFSAWTYLTYCGKMLPAVILSLLLMQAAYYSPKQQKADILPLASPCPAEKLMLCRQTALLGCFAVMFAVQFLVFIFPCILYFGEYAVLSYWLCGLLLTLPCVVLTLAVGALLGKVSGRLIYGWAVLLFALGLLGINTPCDLFCGGFFEAFPLTLPAGADGEPPFQIVPLWLAARLVYLAAGAALTVLNVCRHRAPRRVEAVP